MNAYALADEFRIVAQADDGLVSLNPVNAQAGTDKALPQILFGAKLQALSNDGSICKFALDITVESHASDATGADHAARVDLVRAKFLTGRLAVQDAINGAARVKIFPDISPIETDPGLESHAFKTPLSLAGIVQFL